MVLSRIGARLLALNLVLVALTIASALYLVAWAAIAVSVVAALLVSAIFAATITRTVEDLTRRVEERQRGTETFASEVAHELKNPLSSIRSAAEMLPEVREPEERRRFAGIIQEEVARMERQVSQLAEITRIDARLDHEEQTAVPLNGLLAQIAERFRIRENGRVRFELELPEEVLTARAAPERLTQVFENLLDNAASFSPAGGTVRVTLERASDAGALVTIADQGPGIPPGNLSRIFDRFFSHRPGDAAGRGMLHPGLGLAIAKAIAEGYGGSIVAANAPGGGAAFTVRFPSSRTGVFRQPAATDRS